MALKIVLDEIHTHEVKYSHLICGCGAAMSDTFLECILGYRMKSGVDFLLSQKLNTSTFE